MHCLKPNFFNARLISWGTTSWKAWIQTSRAKRLDPKPTSDSLSCLPTAYGLQTTCPNKKNDRILKGKEEHRRKEYLIKALAKRSVRELAKLR